MTIRAVLFDADGVVQKRPANWRDRLQEMVGRGRDPDRFLEEVFEAEEPLASGGGEIGDVLPDVMRRWGCENSVDDFLSQWNAIEVSGEVTRIIRSLRRSGVRCCLATNQERYRARYMSVTLGYRELFDREFYSCDLGLAKPAPAYFLAILEAVGLPPDEVLFLDDHEENVLSARSVGLHAEEFALPSGVEELRRLLREFGLPINGAEES